MPAAPMRQPNFVLLLLFAWLLVVLQLVLRYWPATATTLLDTDDAMRLVEMHGLLAGHGWFGLHEARVQPPLGYDPHWSRLIDAGLAGLYLLFRPFADASLSERLMRTIWPMLWLVPAMAAAAAIAWRMAGRDTALAVLLFAVIGLPAIQQFKPGRIDHHNVQITIVLLTVAATAWSGAWRHAGLTAGVLTGLGFAIGYEGVPLLVLCGAALALRYIADPATGRDLRNYGFAVAASTAIAFVVSVAPSRWTVAQCDAIAVNTAVPAIVGGFGLALATFWRQGGVTMRGGLVAFVAAIAVTIFIFAEPRCLGGPYVMMDPQVKPIWLMHVREMQPLLAVLAKNPLTAVEIATFPAVAVVAIAVLALRPELRHDFAFQVAAAALLLSVTTMFVAVKAYSYAMWLSMPLVAMLALHLCAALKLDTLPHRFLALMLLTPTALSGGAIGIATAAGVDGTQKANRSPDQDICFRTASYAALAKLPPGLVVTHLDYGPFVLALTPHTVMAAPYHRLSVGIIATHDIFSQPPERAHRLIEHWHVSYIAICSEGGPAGLNGQARSAGLWGRLHAGMPPQWLEREPSSKSAPFAIYRVRS